MRLPLESVVQVSGIVRERKQKVPAQAGEVISPSGAVEVEITAETLLNPAEPSLPFYPNRPEVVSWFSSSLL